MNLFNALSNWKSGRYEKHLSRLKDADRCPDCSGRGYLTEYSYEFPSALECKGCDGSGSYTAWAENNDVE
ncbi:hypothetical protein EV207_12745 [Scopulibacillus darangshiensis]|uniref:Methionine aminopeptidase n=1 Tax=Scopulibacillus darangshiensis TaxID=442528 RepID=A0A4R2NRK5_9BACL|nr:methionine aminopeptidase [Scopulibacillus darangshiensis]TCP24121.1 hypothetical protein EV207_12745 [Scopulibacillus darangshiensis]